MTNEKKVEIWDKAYKSSKTVRETILDVYEQGNHEGKLELLEEIQDMTEEIQRYDAHCSGDLCPGAVHCDVCALNYVRERLAEIKERLDV